MAYFRNKYIIIWAFGLLAAACLWVPQLLVPGLFDRANLLIFDGYQKLKPRKWAGSDVVVVDIDEASIKQIGQWPWPRTQIAQITNRLGELGAAAIVFDMVFSEPDRTSPLRSINRLQQAGAEVVLPPDQQLLDNDVVLANSFAANPVVSGLVLLSSGKDSPPPPKAGHAYSGSEPTFMMEQNVKALRNLPLLDDAATGIGNFSLSEEGQEDGVVRSVDLLRGANNYYYPTLAMEALRVVQGAGGFKLKSTDGSGEVSAGEIQMVSVQVGALVVPTDHHGRLPIYHSLAAAKPTISAAKLLQENPDANLQNELTDQLANHIVLIGTSAAGLLDLRATPIEPVVAGVNVHADILDQIISATYLSRPDFAKGVELFVAIAAVVLLLLLLPNLNPMWSALYAVTLAFGCIGIFWYQFSNNLLLFSPLLPVLSVLLSYTIASAASFLVAEKESRFLRSAFSHYLSPTLVDRLAKNPQQLALGGEEKELTLLFCDIRGFTSLSENLAPAELTELLNSFLTPMTAILLENGATIDKYMGDAIMAFWNAPIDQKNHRELACKSVLDMQIALSKLNAQRSTDLKIGVGLHSGPSCVGNLGSAQRFSYSAIGDSVNVASRIEGLTKQYGLDNLISEDAIPLDEPVKILEIDLVSVVGRVEPIKVFTLIGHNISQQISVFDHYQELHQSMINQYRSGQFAEAEKYLSKLEEAGVAQLAKTYLLYRARIGALKKSGIPENWDGVFVAKSK